MKEKPLTIDKDNIQDILKNAIDTLKKPRESYILPKNTLLNNEESITALKVAWYDWEIDWAYLRYYPKN